ncbi:hypothetical protein SAMN05660860_03024 [Geoalkalibacter ferrihydriticus]|uniref:Flagellar biosynthesis protein FlgN n=2 Tax=Geoalkalibacter ferrihydriticus TaxID=392333 RepID=A0A0C2DQH0_9BACT|nr:hypothetical protein [Geoalkalibacter ferrihydriticus]KIH75644.1 hypothetical protein GFER_15005 [Geoalkalibacter ferrihydriticus DSM 17813]SDM71117.1 hypothetical protein SAMN05660860_03024 [Geoalkalibacter ferrihydriticus]
MTIADLPQAVEVSTRHYAEMLDALAEFDAVAAGAVAQGIVAFAEELHRRRAQVEVFDRVIAGLLPEATSDPLLVAALERRQSLMQQVQDNNRLLSEKIRGMMSVISSELTQARGGRAAMSGYRGAATGRGSIVSGNF